MKTVLRPNRSRAASTEYVPDLVALALTVSYSLIGPIRRLRYMARLRATGADLPRVWSQE